MGSTSSPSMSKHLKPGLFYGIVAGALYLVIDIYFNQQIKITFSNTFGFQHSDSQKHYKIIDNEIVKLPLYLLNRNIATLNFLLWPAILLAVILWDGKMHWLALCSIIAFTELATFSSVHETSMIALLASAILFCLVFFLPRIGLKEIAIRWLLSTLLVTPTAMSAYYNQLCKVEWLPYSVRARIIIWSHTAHEYMKNPI